MTAVGYYVHHEGAGHGALASALSTVLGTRLVGLGSGGRPAGWRGPWVPLPRDDTPPIGPDPTRRAAWHWVPPGHPGFAGRMRAIARWVADAEPAALVTDVSCEVTVLGVLLGVPTVAVVMHGRRDDRPHRATWDSASALVGAWPASHREDWMAPWVDTVEPIGLTSRFDHLPPPPPPAGRRVLVLLPSGAHGMDGRAVDAAAEATAADGWSWTAAGTVPPGAGGAGSPVRWVGPVTDPWPLLVEASVVVAACGAGSVADVAAARRPAVLLPQDRPFDEQRAFAAHLEGVAPVAVRHRWPDASAWTGLLDEVARLDPDRWDPLHDRRGAARFAAVVERAAHPPSA